MISSREKQVKELIKEQISKFARQLGNRKVVLFGSRATGTSRTRSDFDIAVYGDEALPLPVFYEIEDSLEKLPTLYKIDWVDLQRTSGAFKKEALKKNRGTIWIVQCY